MNSVQKRLQDHLGLIRLALFLCVGLNLFSAYRMLSVSLLLAFVHVLVAIALFAAAILIH